MAQAIGFKVKQKGSALELRVKAASQGDLDMGQLQQFMAAPPAGFLRVQSVKKDTVEYAGAAGMSLADRLREPLMRYEFFYVIAQLADGVMALRQRGLYLKDLCLNPNYIFIDGNTREVQLIFLPLFSNQSPADMRGLMESIASVQPMQDHIARFLQRLQTVGICEAEAVMDFIAGEEPGIVAQMSQRNGVAYGAPKPAAEPAWGGLPKTEAFGAPPVVNGLPDTGDFFVPSPPTPVVNELPKTEAFYTPPTPVVNELPKTEAFYTPPQVPVINELPKTEAFYAPPTPVQEAPAAPVIPEPVYQEPVQPVYQEPVKPEPVRPAYQEPTVYVEQPPVYVPPEAYPVPELSSQSANFGSLYRVSTGEVIPVTSASFRLGREKNGSDYVIAENSAVSRNHADIISRGTSRYVVDLNSRNRTYLNGQALAPKTETELHNGDQLRLGDEEFVYRV